MRSSNQLIFSFLSSLLLCFVFSISWAQELIIEPDAGPKPIINFINSAHHNIDLVMYGFTDQDFADAIIQRKAQGETVKILLEEKPYKSEDENKKIIGQLLNKQIDWKGSVPPFRLIHQKTLLVDDEKALIMTFNFTYSTFSNERNFALIVDDPKLVKEIKSVFSADWNNQPIKTPLPELIFSPDSREKIINALSKTQKTLKIYAQNITDYELIGKLAELSRNGITVQILTSSKLRPPQARYLKKAHVQIHYNHQMIIHAKVFIIDDDKAILGSINPTRSSFEDNRELSILIEDKEIIKKLTDTFNQDLLK